MAKSDTYWKDRFEILENAANGYGQDTFRQIEPAFDKAQRQIEKEINAWYGRFAKNNQITIDEARKLLTSSELKELKWDVMEYIKYGEENGLNSMWMKELENASAKFHISRLEALKLRTQQVAEVAFGNELDAVDSMARKVYTEGYYHSIFEVQKGFGVGWDIGQIDERKLDKLISKPWTNDNKTFSDRVWNSKSQMVNELHQQLTRTCVLGKAPDEAIKDMSRFVDGKFKNAKVQAGRLVMTEQAYFHSVAQKEAFEELDVEEFEIVATLDSHTSAICQDMDGQHFPMKEYEPGVTAPPFHPWCRSVTVPYFDDEFSLGERAARDADGKTYYVPSDMTYKEWKKKYINDAISETERKSYEKFKNILGDEVPSIDNFIKIRYNDSEWELFQAYTTAVKSGELTPLADFELYKNISKEIDDKLLGIVTSNNITITGKTKHFIARVIGSVEQRRNGVPIEDILKILNEPDEISSIIKRKNGNSLRFIKFDVGSVSINPNTGILVQVNPLRRKVKK